MNYIGSYLTELRIVLYILFESEVSIKEVGFFLYWVKIDI